MRAFNASGYPWFGMNPPDEELRQVWDEFREGKASRETLEELWDRMTTVAVAEQSRAFIDVVTDGSVRREHLAEWLADGLTGSRVEKSSGGEWKLDISEANGSVREGWLTGPFAVAEDIAQKPLLIGFPGAIEFFGVLGEADRGRSGTHALWTEITRTQIAELSAVGARYFHIEEPRLTEVDAGMRAAALEHVRLCFEALPKDAISMVSYRGSWASKFEELPGTMLYLDCVSDSEALARWSASDDRRAVALGLFDHAVAETTDAAVVSTKLAPYEARLQAVETWVGPNGSLAGLHRDDAFDKLLQVRYLAEEWNRERSQ